MATIRYTIIAGAAPYIAELTNSTIPPNFHTGSGIYEFTNVPNNVYTLRITDSNGCIFERELIVDPLISTTTTTIAPNNSIIVGNAQDQLLIFNSNGTNRISEYVGYPNANISTLYLWLKTLDGKPLISQQVVNYSFTADGNTTLNFNSLSDEIHTNVIQSIVGPASTISGQLILKSGFIETYFMYTYVKDINLPSFIIDLNAANDWLYLNIPVTGGQYGVTYIDRKNVIMKF